MKVTEITTTNPVVNHEGHKDHKCESCGKMFTQARDLKSHIHMIHNNESSQTNYDCDICGKSFTLKQNLTRHRKKHSQDHQCSSCDKVFALEKDFKKHILVIHDGKKGLGCDTCGKVFPKLSNLTLHIKTVHLKERFYL